MTLEKYCKYRSSYVCKQKSSKVLWVYIRGNWILCKITFISFRNLFFVSILTFHLDNYISSLNNFQWSFTKCWDHFLTTLTFLCQFFVYRLKHKNSLTEIRLAVKLLDVFVQGVIGFKNIAAKVADELSSGVR